MSGCQQMALDENLLDESMKGSDPSAFFRLYKWEGIWLSIGKNQKSINKKWVELLNSKKLNIVRRPSGGSAVLHSGGLTYSFVLPCDRSGKNQNYFYHCQWLIKAFKELGISLDFGKKKQNLLIENCFTSSTKADLLDSNGFKRIGSAQLWKNKHLLQHGEILLSPSKDLWEQVFGWSPPEDLPINTKEKDLEQFLIRNFVSFYPEFNWEESSLTEEEMIKISKIALRYKY